MKEVSRLSVAEMLPVLVRMGFVAVCVDRYGYEDNAVAIERELGSVLGGVSQSSPNGRYVSYSMVDYMRTIRDGCTDEEWTSSLEGERTKPLLASSGKGFRSVESGSGRRWRWATDTHASMGLFNPSDRPRPATLKFRANSYVAGTHSLRISVGSFSETIELTHIERAHTFAIEIPPGASSISFDYEGITRMDFPPDFVVFAIINYEVIIP